MRGPDQRRAKIIALSGLALTGFSVFAVFLLEWRSFQSTDGPLFHFLEYAWFPALGTGLLATFLGMIAWARYLGRKRRYQAAAAFFTAGALVLAMPINVHGWTVAFLFVMLGSWATSIALAWMGEEP
jgi:hypothetical protein